MSLERSFGQIRNLVQFIEVLIYVLRTCEAQVQQTLVISTRPIRLLACVIIYIVGVPHHSIASRMVNSLNKISLLMFVDDPLRDIEGLIRGAKATAPSSL